MHYGRRGLERKTLATALQDYVTEWSRQNNIDTDLNVDNDFSLSVNVEQALFRVVQEALSNIARHSQATKASVELIREDSEILLCVADNGKGFDMERMPKGVCLDSMRERLTLIGGTFRVLSEKNVGTQITSKIRMS